MHRLTKANPQRRAAPFFYGWVVLLAGAVGWIMTTPGQTPTVAIFVEHFITDLGLSRSLVSGLYTVGTLLGSLALPFWGRQIDRRGPRVVVVIVAPLFGLACLYMASVNGAFMLGLGFIAIRMLGQGTLSLVSQTAINHWWVRRRGMALGIAGTAMSVVGTGVVPRLAFALVDQYGWRATYLFMGVALIAVMTPVGWFLFRHPPESYGLRPDGDAAELPEADAARPKPALAAQDWSLEEVIRTTTFWLLLVSMGLFSLVMTGLFFHLVRIFEDGGLPPVVAAQAFAPIAVAGAAASLTGGLLSDRLPARVLLVAALLCQMGALLLVLGLNSTTGAFALGALLGLTGGLYGTLNGVLWPSFYGRKHLGSIAGFAMAAGVVGAALGPLPFGVVRDLLGTYQPALVTGAAVSAAFAVANLFLAAPPKARKATLRTE